MVETAEGTLMFVAEMTAPSRTSQRRATTAGVESSEGELAGRTEAVRTKAEWRASRVVEEEVRAVVERAKVLMGVTVREGGESRGEVKSSE